MSLDVYLTTPGTQHPVELGSGIFVRENGATVEISREEWNRRHPDREPVTFLATEETTEQVYSANITHNLGKMADEAAIYKCLWRPEEVGITKARQLIRPLCDGLLLLEQEPERFKAFNPSNGWGTYESFVEFVREYLIACIQHPEANVEASR